MGLFRDLVLEHQQARTLRAIHRRARMVAECCAEIRLERTFARLEGEITPIDDYRLMRVELRACDVMRHTDPANA